MPDSVCPFYPICTAVGGGCEEITHGQCKRFLTYVKVHGEWKANGLPNKHWHNYYDPETKTWVPMESTTSISSRKRHKRNRENLKRGTK